MKMKLCSECGKIADYNSYFRAYRCNYCSWKEETPEQQKILLLQKLVEKQKEYIKFLGEELGKLAIFSYVHGNVTPEHVVRQGELLRQEIQEIQEIIDDLGEVKNP